LEEFYEMHSVPLIEGVVAVSQTPERGRALEYSYEKLRYKSEKRPSYQGPLSSKEEPCQSHLE